MSEHFATGLAAVVHPVLIGGRGGWYDSKEWAILCACGQVFEPRYEQGTDSRTVTATERIQRHISMGGNSDGMPARPTPASPEEHREL